MEKKISFKQYLEEAPLGDYQTFGKFPKGSSFQGKTDPVLISSPKAIENVRKKFGKTPYIVNMYFVNRKEVAQYSETGSVSIDWVRENIGEDVAEAIAPHYQEEGNVNIVYVSNRAAQKVPMTPWIMAHRMSHAFQRNQGNMNKGFYNFQEVVNTVDNFLDEILTNVYHVRNYKKVDGSSGWSQADTDARRQSQLRMIQLFNQLSTFKSARDKNIREYFEIYHELFAQYVIEGSVKFNQLPQKVGTAGWGNYPLYSNKEDREEYQSVVDGFANTLNYYFNELMGEASKGILVM